jgi:hypothetical protein
MMVGGQETSRNLLIQQRTLVAEHAVPLEAIRAAELLDAGGDQPVSCQQHTAASVNGGERVRHGLFRAIVVDLRECECECVCVCVCVCV